MTADEHRAAAARRGDVAASADLHRLLVGVSQLAGLLGELPADASSCLPRAAAPGTARSATHALAQAWNLAAFAPASGALMRLLEADAARIEVLPDAEFALRHPRSGAEGCRLRAMGNFTADDGSLVQLSCRMILRLPAATAGDVRSAALALVQHAAEHALLRLREPLAEPSQRALEEAVAALGSPLGDVLAEALVERRIPRGVRPRAWARAVRSVAAAELGLRTASGLGGNSRFDARDYSEH